MSRLVVLVADPSEDLTCRMAAELRSRFRNIHVLTANTRERVVSITERLQRDQRRLALTIIDVDWSEALDPIGAAHPSSKAALLCDPESRVRAVQEIAAGRGTYFIFKDWNPAKERLWPVVEDLLSEWAATNDPAREPIQIYGNRWDAKSHEIRDFLARNHAHYEWVDVFESPNDPAVQRLSQDKAVLPQVRLPGGEQIESPSLEDLAQRIGFHTEPDRAFYDLVIVGAGPSGLAAAVYGASEGLKTLVVEREAPGGQAGCSTMIENYLGFPHGLTGADLARRATEQATRFHAEILDPQEAIGLTSSNGYRRIRLADERDITSRTVILTMGVSYRRLECEGEEQLYGRGVYYGSTIGEAIECADEQVVIVGGGNSAGQAALHFADHAKKVTMVFPESSLERSMSSYLIERIGERKNIEVRSGCHVEQLQGDGRLEAVIAGGSKIPCTSVFVFIGMTPHTDWLPSEISRDEDGYIVTGPAALENPGSRWPLKRAPRHLETSMPGVFAAGDVRSGSTHRIASAVGEGSAAVQLVHVYLREIKA